MPHQCTSCGRTFADGSKEMLSGCPDCGGNKFQFVPKGAVTSDAPTDDSHGTTSDNTPGTPPDSTPGTPPDSTPGTTLDDTSGTAPDDTSGTAPDDTLETAPSRNSDARPDESPWPPADSSNESPPFDGFSEWPDSARRPEDRSSSEGDGSAAARGTDATEIDDDGFEDTAQADARSSVVPPEELPDPPAHQPDSLERDHEQVTHDSSPRESVPPEDEPPAHGQVISEPSGERPSLEELREELNDQFESIKIVRPGEYELNLMELYNRDEYIISLQEDGRYVIDVPDSWRNGK